MKLYEINEELQRLFDLDPESETHLVDPETGEVIFGTADEIFNQLAMAWDQKIEGIALLIKNNLAEAEAIRAEEIKLAERRRVKENAAARLKEFLGQELNGTKFESARVKISYRKSTSVEITGEVPVQYLRVKTEPDKTALKKALEVGEEIPGAELVTKNGIIIK